MKHQHPIKIIKLMTKNFWLLLIPLVRGLIHLHGDIYSWVRGAWVDILVILVIAGAAFLRWYFTWYELRGSSIVIKRGVIARARFTVPFTSVCAISAERKFFFRPIRAVNLYLDTNSGTIENADIQITVSLKDYETLFKLISKRKDPSGFKTSYRPSQTNLVLFSFVFSSTLSGVVFLATLLIQSSKIVGRSLEQTLMTAVTDVSHKLAFGLPPLAIAVSLVMAAGWIFSFASNLLRHLGFKIERINKIINIRTGFFTKRHYYINSDKINYADLRQNLLTKLFSIMSVHVNCSGYGKAKNEIPVFVPITTKDQVFSSLQLLLPNMSVVDGGIKPRWNYFFRFIWVPLFAMLGIPVAAFILNMFFPLWNSMILFVAVMSEIPIIWLLIAKFTHFFTTRISYSDKSLCLKYSFGYAFHTILIPKNKIAKITVRQSIFQTPARSCDVRIYSNSEFTKCHRVICMPIDDVLELLKASDLSTTEIGNFRK